jgi:uncharacterized phage-associated protein
MWGSNSGIGRRRDVNTSDIQDINLFNVIIALLRKAGRNGLTKTQLIKLVFFVDLESCRATKKPLTACRYRTDHYGVVDYGIWDTALAIDTDRQQIRYSPECNYYGTPTHRIFLVNDIYGDIAPEIMEVLDRVWKQYGKMNAAQLGGITKTLIPMDDEWEEGVAVDPRDMVYEESPEFQDHCRKVLDTYPEHHTEVRPIDELVR